MVWSTPYSWTNAEVIEVAKLNSIRDNLQFLYDARGSYAVIADQKAAGMNGGNSAVATWNARDLNTEISDADNIVSIASNRFTPVAGTYYIDILSTFSTNAGGTPPGSEVLRLWNFDLGAVVSGVVCRNSTAAASLAVGDNRVIQARGIFTANGSHSFRLDMYSANVIGNGLGAAQGGTSVEIYTLITLVKIG